MSPAKQDEPTPANPETPRRVSVAKHGNATTPANKRASAQSGVTPKSAPAAAGRGSAQKKKPEPTLLADFLLGRPSPARLAAQREALKQRRKSMADAANVREELRQEMRAAAVRRLQQPGGVRDRVEAWQKANAAAMKGQGGGVPHAEDVASEPTEVGAHLPPESVTEEDRVRIKMRQSSRKKKVKAEKVESKKDQYAGSRQDAQQESSSGARPEASSEESAVIKKTPKKRIVSDDNWMKRRKGKSAPHSDPPKPKVEGSPTPIPKDFLQRTARNPTLQSKIRDWAERVAVPEPPRVTQHRHRKSGATVTVEEETSSLGGSGHENLATPRSAVSDGIRVVHIKPKLPQPDTDDGIRISPVRKKELPDDGIRVRPKENKLPDDGIRVRPLDSPLPDDGIRVRPSQQIPVDEAPDRHSSPRLASVDRSTRVPSTRRGRSPDDVIEVFEEVETEVDTPTKRKVSRRRSRRRSRSPSPVVRPMEPREGHKHSGPEGSRRVRPREASDDESERIPPTMLGNKSLADIPVGYSAFSELDLPLGADARNSTKRPKAQRNQSFKAMPKVLKKVVTGAKEIIQEKVEPPRPAVANQPQSIESWLNSTVDPFVETAPKAQDSEPTPELPRQAPDSLHQSSSRSPSQSRQKETLAVEVPTKGEAQGKNSEPQQEDSDATPKKAKSPTTPSTDLKRRRATRITSSPLKSGGKKSFRDLLKEAFRGESGGHKLPPMIYSSYEADYDSESYHKDDEWESTDESRRSTSPTKRPPSPEYSSTYGSTVSSELSSHGLQRKRPPTNGVHELSTIVSENSSSTVGSEAISDVSQTTVTQTTAFTKSTQASRQKSQKSSIERRLTKHSDLVSVLSLPDDGQLVPPRRSKSVKSSRSLHRRPSRANKSKVNELLREFADDEHFYGRELKTLVDGVVPVLLKDVMSGGTANKAGIFGRIGVGDVKTDAMAKSVVNMGVALEKLRAMHRRVPLSDVGELLAWFEAVSPVYDEYLDVWRLGFQGLIINLAPKLGRFDDNDSLLNALPLNEDGDVVGQNGERVDVAFLMKRPLIRVKWMTKFLRAAVAVSGAPGAKRLLSVFEALQGKARQRHREETARMMDEDANNTDTTRCRDLRNLLPLDEVLMNRARQVVALDVFALDLHHSSGQRLECQVELIYRDNPEIPADKGDILIREIGNGTRSWLLFPPVPTQNISARRADGEGSLVVMIRGTHNGNEWYELLKLSTNSEEQVAYWLEVLGSQPVPPATRMVPEGTSPKSNGADVPVGERRLGMPPLGSLDADKSATPSRYHARQHPDLPSTPPSPSPPSLANISPDRTPPREDYLHIRLKEDPEPPYGENLPSEAGKASRPPPNSTPYREDGAPPPPIHRTLGPKSSGLLAPPVDVGPHARVKRRTSSPLKHEYHPSDVSSDSSSSLTDDDSDSSQSSSDELDEDEVPDTIPGYSIKETEVGPVDSVVSDDNRITPSNSGSQVEAIGQDNAQSERPAQQFTASVSYWSTRKGIWKDVNNGQPASIVVRPGSMEVHNLSSHQQTSGISEADTANKHTANTSPLLVLVLTPVVMIRRSNALDLEVRSPASPESRLRIESGMFRFRSAAQVDAQHLYEAVHISRLNNARYIQLAEEARVRAFGQMQAVPGNGNADDDSSSRRRSWFGRKNSYRASARAPSVSQGSVSTTISAGSFLRRLIGGGNTAFNIDDSTVDRQPRPGSAAAGGGGSLYTSSASSSGDGGGGGSSTPPRSVSISLSGSGSHSRWSNGLAKPFSPDKPLEIRCHLNVNNNRWLDKGDCVLHISRPPPGVRQELPLYHGLEKRVIVTHATRKAGDRPLILLDAVLGSKCFSMLGTKGVMCSVWENLRDEEGNVGVVPKTGAVAGRVTKWCFQCKSTQQAQWIMGLLTSEVPGLMMMN
ncbi:hypothetical protein VTK56DRAFT_178 [Thermocarpiscus australiensis]